jgi:hypothetical protein
MITSFIMLVLEAEGRSNGNITLDPGRNIFAYRHCDDLCTHDGCARAPSFRHSRSTLRREAAP